MKIKDADYDDGVLPADLHLPRDPPAMTYAIDLLTKTGIGIHRPGPYHLKYGKLNYYPTKSTYFVDGGSASIKMALTDFLDLLIKHYLERTGKHKFER